MLAPYYLNESPSFKSELNFSVSDILKAKSNEWNGLNKQGEVWEMENLFKENGKFPMDIWVRRSVL